VVVVTVDKELSARARLIEATRRLVAERGFDVSVRQIAAEAGVTHGLVLHHFGGKDGLIAQTTDSVLQHARSLLDGFPHSASADVVGDLRLIVEEFVAGDRETSQYMARVISRGDAHASALFNGLVDAVVGVVERLVESGHIPGETDVAMRSVQLATMELGLLILAPLVANRCDVESIHHPQFVRRWFDSELSMLFGNNPQGTLSPG
jgi:TetR/AcrR family transcriptional regulator, regulator of cefoperazone and chloramphenicol sensitivity